MNICANLLKTAFKGSLRRPSYLSSIEKVAFYSSSQFEPKNEAGERKKTRPIPKISLIHEDAKMEVITLDQAKKIAEKRQLKLVNVIDYDTKSKRPVYK